MIDLPSAGMAAVRDPLVVTLFTFSLLGLLTHFLFRRHPLGRALVRVFFLIVLTIVLLRAGVVPYQPLTQTGEPFQDAVHAALKIAWWLWAAWFVVGFLRVFVVTEHRPREGKLVQDLLAGLVYLAALFAIIAYVFDLPIKGLLATSGAIAIILGLALQSTLSDVFSGIVLEFQPSLSAGRLDQHRRRHRRPRHRDELARDPCADGKARSGDCPEQHDRQGQDRQRQLALRHPRHDRDGQARRQNAARGRRRNPATCDPELPD